MRTSFTTLIFISVFIVSPVYGSDTHIIQTEEKVVLDASAGTKPDQIGIHFVENPTVVSDSINPIVVSNANTILIGDSLNHRVLEFDMSGKAIRQLPVLNRSAFITSLTIGYKNNIYVLSGHVDVDLRIFAQSGELINIIDLSKIGRREKGSDGRIKLVKDVPLSGGESKVLTDSKGNIFVLGDDLVNIDKTGKVLHRWGPYVYDFLIDHDDSLYICYLGALGIEIYDRDYKLTKKINQYTGDKFIGSEWGAISWPYHIDADGNLYGFVGTDGHNLARYSVKRKSVEMYSLKQDDFIGASWTVDQQGNIYVAEAVRSFTVTKTTPLKQH